ncbi:uncharacterized protein LOC135839498 [Planococcus citri]|uniref:uncharacterized protein LOC135839498 n=1 Tax=Planococcus citri TaxID=170843 RepID=UPI0031F8CBB0
MAHAGYSTLMTWLSLPLFVSSVHNNDWKPMKSKLDVIIEPNSLPQMRLPSRKISPVVNSCSLYKASMDQHTFHQYIQYKHHIPDLHEFTLCAWIKLFNYSADHTIFSYGQPHKSQIIGAKISNTPKKTWYSLIVNGHTLYRINYPVKLFKWYHVCQSWNGKTGEWQIWINSERISRGYYNLMVGKTIKSGGTAISGQDQLDHDVTFSFKKRRVGFQGEITLLQLYKAALSKGKAYSDHRHHHGQSDEDHQEPTADPNAEDDPSKELTTEHPFLENGQLKPRLPVDELLAKDPASALTDPLFPSDGADSAAMLLNLKETSFDSSFPHLFNFPRNRNGEKKLKFDNILGRLKRNLDDHSDHSSATAAAENDQFGRRRSLQQTKSAKKYQPEDIRPDLGENKRVLMLSHPPTGFDSHLSLNSGFSPFYSGPNAHPYHDTHSIFKEDFFNQERFPTKLEYEPAEWEVRKIGEVCSACDEDPFRKANVLSWQETPKKLFAGAEYIPAIPKCHIF